MCAGKGWSFALNFCFFFFKEKEKRKMLLDTFAKVSDVKEDDLGVPAQKRQCRRAGPLQSFLRRGSKKDFRLHPSRGSKLK
ncbi:MAG: hypothetical protein V4677_04400 [Bacteroidota bacterium]